MRFLLVLFVLIAAVSVQAGSGRRPLVHGHRGARAAMPENTLPAFEYAIRQGVDVLELDLAVTKDDVLVVSHDPTINPDICTGPKMRVPIRSLTLAELQAYDCGSKRHPDFAKQQTVPGTRIPTLDDVLKLAPRGNFGFNIETKISPDKPDYAPSPAKFAQLLADAIRRHKLEKRVIVQSFDFRTLHAMKKIAPELRRSALYMASTVETALGRGRDFVELAREADATIVSPHYKLVTPERVAAAHKAGLQVVPWTANTAEDWQRMIDAGADAIITDDPAGLISYLKSRVR